MQQVIEAVYENGVLRLQSPLTGLSQGQRVWVTVGEPHDLSQPERRESDLIRDLETRGLVEKPSVPPAPGGFRPLQLPGPSLSETILAERR